MDSDLNGVGDLKPHSQHWDIGHPHVYSHISGALLIEVRGISLHQSKIILNARGKENFSN